MSHQEGYFLPPPCFRISDGLRDEQLQRVRDRPGPRLRCGPVRVSWRVAPGTMYVVSGSLAELVSVLFIARHHHGPYCFLNQLSIQIFFLPT